MSRFRTLIAYVVVFVLGSAPGAFAWNADFFEKDASGAATYEEMAIAPQAVYDAASNRTFIAYQGYLMDPYVMAYDHQTARWIGPQRVGGNTLGQNTHGAPSLVIDAAGHLVVFYGGHLGALSHARSKRPGDIGTWVDLGPVRVGSEETTISATYPQAGLDAKGAIRLSYRRDGAVPSRGDWESVVSTPAAGAVFGWTEPEILIDGSVYNSAEPTTTGSYWYANVDHDAAGGTALAAVRRDLVASETDFRVRKGVYYLERSAEETWTSAAGVPVTWPRGFASLEVTAAVRAEEEAVFTNQVVLRRDRDGVPGVLYLAGSHDTAKYEWRFARWDGSEWVDRAIATTDNFFDAGTFEFMSDGTIEAFLTTGGVPDDQWLDDPATAFDESTSARRGGDISWWRSEDGASWTKVRDIIKSPGAHARYNNPQIVRNHADGARIVFSEWNNDAANFIHKVYLWGDEGFKQQTFTPKVHRLAGDDRIATAVEISAQGFPFGATTAVVAASHDFPDVLCGVPLAQALRAPVLLSRAGSLDSALAAELGRLGVTNVVILGGEQAVSADVERSIRVLRAPSGAYVRTSRIAGENRYDTSARIARRVVELRGTPKRVILASGETFADALAVSPYAARRGYPVLLTPPSRVSTFTAEVIGEISKVQPLGGITVVGGVAAVTPEVVLSYRTFGAVGSSDRWGGADRYETAAIIAGKALDSGHSLQRFALATGENFADAVGGGLLMARYNGVVLTTPSNRLHPAAAAVLDARAFGPGTGVLDVYVLGGPVAVGSQVVDSLAARLNYLDKAASQ